MLFRAVVFLSSSICEFTLLTAASSTASLPALAGGIVLADGVRLLLASSSPYRSTASFLAKPHPHTSIGLCSAVLLSFQAS